MLREKVLSLLALSKPLSLIHSDGSFSHSAENNRTSGSRTKETFRCRVIHVVSKINHDPVGEVVIGEHDLKHQYFVNRHTEKRGKKR